MSSKTITTIAAIVLIIGGVIATLAFMFGDIGNPSQISSSKNSNNIQSEKQATNTSTTDKEQYEELTFPDNTLDTSDWETYRNEEFGFAVDHPEGWEMERIAETRFVIRPVSKKGPNDDGGVYISLSRAMMDEIVKNANAPDKMLKSRVVNNGMRGVVFDYKLGVWSEDRGPDQRKTYQSYLFDIGEYRIEFYEPSADEFRTRVLERVVSSLAALK